MRLYPQYSNIHAQRCYEIPRKLQILLIEKFRKGKALVVVGARQTGKTTLVKEILSKYEPEALYLNCDEPLTGRKLEFMLHPISLAELLDRYGELSVRDDLERRIIFGMYPDVINHPGDEEELLRNLSGSVLYKDILSLRDIRRPAILEKLLQALAFQIGNEVSNNELSNLVGVDRSTIENYIGLLGQACIIFRLRPLARNLRNEISTSRKIYFWDTGIRNAVISNFSPLGLRSDTGALWENFIIVERLKYWAVSERSINLWFWRTYQGQEIDYIEEYGGAFHAYECKWNERARQRIPKVFLSAYQGAGAQFVTPANALPFVTGSDVEG